MLILNMFTCTNIKILTYKFVLCPRFQDLAYYYNNHQFKYTSISIKLYNYFKYINYPVHIIKKMIKSIFTHSSIDKND